MKQLSPAQFVATCAALGRLGSVDRKEWTVLCNALKAHCESTRYRLSPSQVAVCLYSIGKSGNSVCVRDRVLVSAFKHLLQESNEWSPVDLGWLLYFMRKKDVVDHPVWERLLKQIVFRFNERMSQMSVKNIACILQELSIRQLLPAQAIHRALRVVDERGAQIDAKSASLLLAALARLGVYRSDFLFSFADRITGIHKVSSRQATWILHSMAKLGVFHRPLLNTVLGRVNESLSDIDIVMTAHALGRLGIVSSGKELGVLCAQFEKRIKQMTPMSVSVFIGALGKVVMADPHFLAVCSRHVGRNELAFTPRQRISIMNSLATLGFDSATLTLPDLADLDPQFSRFQVNKVMLSKDVSLNHDAFPVMAPKSPKATHATLSDFLRINGASEVVTCSQVGAVYADVTFVAENQSHAIIILGDSDVCKIDNKRILGPMQWVVNHIKSHGFTVTLIHKRDARMLENLWTVPALAPFVTTETRRSGARTRLPYRFDAETGKISFRQISRCR